MNKQSYIVPRTMVMNAVVRSTILAGSPQSPWADAKPNNSFEAEEAEKWQNEEDPWEMVGKSRDPWE